METYSEKMKRKREADNNSLNKRENPTKKLKSQLKLVEKNVIILLGKNF